MLADVTEPVERGGGGERLRPEIDHALCAFPRAVAERGRRVLARLLRARLDDEQSKAWDGSRLTGDGYPLELSFCSSDARLRCTVEPGRATLPASERLGAALAALASAGERIETPVATELRAVQSDAPLAFGAWIGCRVSWDSAVSKLYVELPPGRVSAMQHLPPALADRVAVPRMLAFVPATETFETYFRVPALEPRHLRAVLAPAGREDDAARLLELVERAYGHRVRGRLPGPSVGVSYSSDAAQHCVALHFYARALWGSDARIRRGFARLASAFAWNDETYLRVTEPLAARESWKTYHGMLSIALGASSRMSVSVGLRPIAP